MGTEDLTLELKNHLLTEHTTLLPDDYILYPSTVCAKVILKAVSKLIPGYQHSTARVDLIIIILANLSILYKNSILTLSPPGYSYQNIVVIIEQ